MEEDVPRTLDVGIVTDEVSRNLEEALTLSSEWGVTRFELREGATARFPEFTADEAALVEDRLRHGTRVTAVSPGILKGPIEDADRLRTEMTQTLPRALELAQRFDCPMLIVFGFERAPNEAASLRRNVLRAFEEVAERAAAAGLTVAIENEPNFWVDRPRETAAMLEEIGHPALKANWDPANAHWGGLLPDHDDFLALLPHIANVHVKDFDPYHLDAPWRPVGQGRTPWAEFLRWIVEETDLNHVTLETHCLPLAESSRQSLEWMRDLLTRLEAER